jgi:hypothetical protein
MIASLGAFVEAALICAWNKDRGIILAESDTKTEHGERVQP